MGTSKLRLMALVGFLAMQGLLVNCSSTVSGGTEALGVMSMDVNRYPVNQLMCNPLAANTPSNNPQAGLRASLSYLQSDQPRYHNVRSMMTMGHVSDQILFFSDLNVPTRLFSVGFANESGNTVKDDQGNLLVEYFSLRFNGSVKLASNQAEGLYQFATLADDGVIWTMQDDAGTVSPLITDDGDHSTKMGCSTKAIAFDGSTQRKMQLDYYQGPRHQIALVTMMRKVNDINAPLDPTCGQWGNSLYFNYNNSLPQPEFTKLMARGWVVMTPDNFLVPDDAQFNPCKAGTNPIISNFRTIEATGKTIEVRWTTDIPATSQVMYSDPSIGTSEITLSDNLLRTDHLVYVTGLKRRTLYSLQAVSISADYGRSVSSAITGSTAQ